jgi:hypothetical protein
LLTSIAHVSAWAFLFAPHFYLDSEGFLLARQQRKTVERTQAVVVCIIETYEFFLASSNVTIPVVQGRRKEKTVLTLALLVQMCLPTTQRCIMKCRPLARITCQNVGTQKTPPPCAKSQAIGKLRSASAQMIYPDVLTRAHKSLCRRAQHMPQSHRHQIVSQKTMPSAHCNKPNLRVVGCTTAKRAPDFGNSWV